MSTLNGITDQGIRNAARMKQKAQVAYATVMTGAQLLLANKRKQIQERYLKIAEEQRSYYSTNFRPLEDLELKDALDRFEQDQNPDELMERVSGALAKLRIMNVGAQHEGIRCLSEYNTGAAQMVIESAAQQEAMSATYAKILGEFRAYQDEEAAIDRGFNAVLQALNRGRGLGAQHLALSAIPSSLLSQMRFQFNYSPPVKELHDKQYEGLNLRTQLPTPPPEPAVAPRPVNRMRIKG